MTYKGFKYNNKTYIWKSKQLFRLPYFHEKRGYGLHKCKSWKNGFILGNQRKSLKQLQGITIDIEVDFQFQESKDTPF